MKGRAGVVWIFLLSALAGCGYTLNHRVREEFRSSRGVFIPVFGNLTDEVGAETVFTNALVREIISRRQVKLSGNQRGALELKGIITAIQIAPTTLTEAGFRGLQSYQRLPSELGIRVNIQLELRDPRDEKTLWRREFTAYRRVNAPTNRTSDFQAPSSIGTITQSVWEAEYPELARQIMRDVYDEMVEVF